MKLNANNQMDNLRSRYSEELALQKGINETLKTVSNELVKSTLVGQLEKSQSTVKDLVSSYKEACKKALRDQKIEMERAEKRRMIEYRKEKELNDIVAPVYLSLFKYAFDAVKPHQFITFEERGKYEFKVFFKYGDEQKSFTVIGCNDGWHNSKDVSQPTISYQAWTNEYNWSKYNSKPYKRTARDKYDWEKSTNLSVKTAQKKVEEKIDDFINWCDKEIKRINNEKKRKDEAQDIKDKFAIEFNFTETYKEKYTSIEKKHNDTFSMSLNTLTKEEVELILSTLSASRKEN